MWLAHHVGPEGNQLILSKSLLSLFLTRLVSEDTGNHSDMGLSFRDFPDSLSPGSIWEQSLGAGTKARLQGWRGGEWRVGSGYTGKL